MANNQSLTKTYDELPLLARIIIQIFAGAIVGGIYRIVRYTETKNTLTLVAGLLTCLTGVGNFIAWVVDLITLVLYGKYTVLVD